MKSLLKTVLFIGCMAPWAAFSASNGSYSVVTKYGDETSINYRRTSEPMKMYLDVRADLSFLSWTNEYTPNQYGDDDFDFKSVIGADIALGCRFNKHWRADVELGYMGRYSEQETEYYPGFPTEKTDFSLTVMNATVNGYYNIWAGMYSGVYMGLGAGAAISEISLNHTVFAKEAKKSVSPMGAVMLGWTNKLNEKIDLNLRYKFAAFSGATLDYNGVSTKIGLITDNSVSVGIRYEF